jgi:2-succinyl-5-enolpyruvyl-6-hydroxy-3-cyclohexene-1-carboxylate synthase
MQVFSETYTRWFRDIAPPSEDVPISLAISDANHAATIAQDMLGPVHLNIQFRENLAPEGGPIRGDGRPNSITTFSASRFTDVPGFQRWSIHGKKWTNSYGLEKLNDTASIDVANLIAQSKRGIIVLGNIRKTDATGGTSHSTNISAIISDFAKFTGFPVFAGAQSAAMRFESSAVIPYAGECPFFHIVTNSYTF